MAVSRHPREQDGFLTKRQRQERLQWVEAARHRDSRALERLFERASTQEGLALLAGCASAWAVKESPAWGAQPSPAWFEGFADALNTAPSAPARRSVWRAWPAIVAMNKTEEGWERQAWQCLSKVVDWIPEEGKRLLVPALSASIQEPHRVRIAGRGDPCVLTPLQLAWAARLPALCKILVEYGATPDQPVVKSGWPRWTLQRAMDGLAEDGADLQMDGDARRHLQWAAESLRGRLAVGDPEWLGLAQYLRHRSLEHRLPAPMSARPGLRF